ncbi:MAG: beta-N-acetylglucosaminidase domain-containing protein [Sphingomonas sp.]|nr:beta-N-acetylglucosaminidase domain-containing protein [Sphingomonas sp.]
MTPELGLIEGFFGRPWSWAARRETVAFLRGHGYGFYLYAPKADVWLRRRWQEPWPGGEFAELLAFRDFCRLENVRFGIGLTPFELHLQAERGWQGRFGEKLVELAQLQPDDLAILFDDMRGDVPGLAARQAAIVHFAAERGAARRILMCPSYYSDDPILDVAFGARPPHYLATLGRLLDPAIDVMWTGEEVCAREIAPGHLARVAEQLRRKPFLWDNYPVNDGARMSQHLHLRAFTGRPAAIGGLIAGHGINPASQPMLSRIPALTLAESYAKGDAYEYGAAFVRAARDVLGEALAERIGRDLLTLQDRGLDRLGDRLAGLRDRYAAFDHPAAREILAWLDGHWTVSDELVLTQ